MQNNQQYRSADLLIQPRYYMYDAIDTQEAEGVKSAYSSSVVINGFIIGKFLWL